MQVVNNQYVTEQHKTDSRMNEEGIAHVEYSVVRGRRRNALQPTQIRHRRAPERIPNPRVSCLLIDMFLP